MSILTKNELIDRYNQLPPIENTEETFTPYRWNERRIAIRNHVATEDIDNFLHWSTIRATMVANDNKWIRAEMKEVIEYFGDRGKALLDPNTGNPIMIDNLGVSGPSIHQGYHIMNWEKYTGRRIEDVKRIVEFGGGYGRLCSIVYGLGFDGEYYIYDLPELSYLQEYYLSNNGISDVKYMIVNDANEFDDPPEDVDVLFGMNSLDEVTEALRIKFINSIGAANIMLAVNIGKKNYDNIMVSIPNKTPTIIWKYIKSSSRAGLWYIHGKKVINV